MERARQIQNTYGDNYAQVYEDIINQYNTNYWNLPNPVIKQLDAKAKMQAKDAAVNRYITRRQPAGYDDFEYQINRNLTEMIILLLDTNQDTMQILIQPKVQTLIIATLCLQS